jgi:hypothetical protein
MSDAVGVRADITLSQTFKAYTDLTGFDPYTGQKPGPGVFVGDAMRYWASTGIGGHRISASEWSNAIGQPFFYAGMIKRSVFYMGGAILGLTISKQAQMAFNAGQPWVAGMAGGEGHCVPALAYDDDWCDVITWGRPQRLSWGFVQENLTELWAVLSPDWIGYDGLAPCGVPHELLAQNLPGWLAIIAG